jgi:hypothetical protein
MFIVLNAWEAQQRAQLKLMAKFFNVDSKILVQEIPPIERRHYKLNFSFLN